MVEKFFLCVLVAFFLAVNTANALPILYNQTPPSGTYWPGGLTNFSVYVTEGALNTSDVYMEIKAAEEKSGLKWDRHYLGCSQMNENTNFCSKQVSLFIVGDDTLESFYFNASDTFSNYGSLGNRTHPLNITIDINPPITTPYNFNNFSYVSAKKELQFIVFDKSSGVNTTLTQSLFGNVTSKYGNTTWNSSYTTMTYSNPYFSMKMNYTGLINNGTYGIYVNATDNVGNWNESKIVDVFIDNILPNMNVIYPQPNDLIYGVSPILLNANDTLSGVDSNVTFLIMKGSTIKSYNQMSCYSEADKKMNCSYSLNTASIGNDDYKIIFFVQDLAGNEINQSFNIRIDNSALQLFINKPIDNSYVNGVVAINANIANHENRITGVKIRFDPTNDPWFDMTCDNSLYCDYFWNTNNYQERSYKVTINATGNFNYHLNKSITLTVDRTLPQLFIVGPTNTTLTDVVYPQLIVTDENLVNSTSIRFSIANTSSSMTCTDQLSGKLYNCAGAINTYLLNNGTYSLTFEGKDYAGNRNTSSIQVTVANAITNASLLSNVTIGNLTNETLNLTFPTVNLTTTTTTSSSIISIFDPGKQTSITNETKNITIIQVLSSPLQSAVKAIKDASLIKKVTGISILILIISSILFFIFGRKTVKQPPKIEILSIKNIDSLFVEERSKLQFAYNYITSAFGMNDMASLRDYVKNAIGYLEKMDKTSFLKSGFAKSLEFASNAGSKELSQFIKDNVNQIYVDQNGKEISREKYINEIKDKLDTTLGTDDINQAHEIVGQARIRIEEFIKFSDKEIETWKRYIELANSLQKTDKTEEKTK